MLGSSVGHKRGEHIAGTELDFVVESTGTVLAAGLRHLRRDVAVASGGRVLRG